MTDHTEPLKAREAEIREQAATINAGRKPKFGDRMRNPWASEQNPTRDGFFVREKHVTGRFNPGLWYEMTDGKGKFWESDGRVMMFVDHLPDASLSSSQPVAGELADTIAAIRDHAHAIEDVTCANLAQKALSICAALSSAQQERQEPKKVCQHCNGIGNYVGQHDGYDDAECSACDGTGLAALSQAKEQEPFLTKKQIEDVQFAWDRLHHHNEHLACQYLMPILDKFEAIPPQAEAQQDSSVQFNIHIPKGCDCQNVQIGSYTNQVELPTPPHMLARGRSGCTEFRPTTCVDRCIAQLVQALWNQGIVTTGCCCGHNEVDGYIGIEQRPDSQHVGLVIQAEAQSKEALQALADQAQELVMGYGAQSKGQDGDGRKG